MGDTYNLVGFKRSSFTAKDTGVVYLGYRLYVSQTRDGVTGSATDSIYVPDAALPLGFDCFQVDQRIRVSYNKWGKVSGIEIVA